MYYYVDTLLEIRVIKCLEFDRNFLFQSLVVGVAYIDLVHVDSDMWK